MNRLLNAHVFVLRRRSSPIFWRRKACRSVEAELALGAFDKPTGTKLALHIFVAEKGDYYEITDHLPQNQH